MKPYGKHHSAHEIEEPARQLQPRQQAWLIQRLPEAGQQAGELLQSRFDALPCCPQCGEARSQRYG